MSSASVAPITEAFNYGAVRYSLTQHGGRHVTLASDDEVQAVLRHARRCIKSRVNPALEKVIEDAGLPIDGEYHAHLPAEDNVHLASTTWSELVDCEFVVPKLPEEVKAEAREVLDRELFEPMEDFIRGDRLEDEDDSTSRLVKAVRSALSGFGG